MATGTHDHADDPRNAEILIWVNGELLPRDRAVVSVFDSGFVLGRRRLGGAASLGRVTRRSSRSTSTGSRRVPARSCSTSGMSREEITEAIYATLRANEMTDGVHVRLMVTRGVKSTPYQDPRMTIGPATVVIIAEHKEPMPATVSDGITLFTTHVRRATPDTLDPKLNAHSKLNDIQACIQAYTAGADEALMLDPQGFVATCNSTHFFIVNRAGEVWTSDGRFCLAGITRGNVLEICHASGIPARETTFSLTDVYSAAEAFVTGTFAGVVPVHTVDGRTIGTGARGPVVHRLQELYQRHVAADVGTRVMTVRVAVWSGPRNISTAMMRSWENRPDTVVVDEPFYAAYLKQTGLDHPARDKVIASQPTDPDEVVRRFAPTGRPRCTTPST